MLSTPPLRRAKLAVLTALCRPALRHQAFVAPASVGEIARELVMTEAAVKQHLLRLYQKFETAAGLDRRTRLADQVISTGVVSPRLSQRDLNRGGTGPDQGSNL